MPTETGENPVPSSGGASPSPSSATPGVQPELSGLLKDAFGRIDAMLAQRAQAAASTADPQQKEREDMVREGAMLGPVPEQGFLIIKALLSQKRVDDALRVAAQLDLSRVMNVAARRFHDFADREKLVYAEARHVAIATPQAIVSLVRAVDYILKNAIPGALIECGVYQGGSIIAMIRTLLLNGVTDRDIFLFDTFEGMPRPGQNDVYYTGESAIDTWQHNSGTAQGSNWVKATLDDVKARVLATGYPQERIHFVKGLVEDTVPAGAPEKIALLRLDTDFYSSTKHELDHLFPRLSRGGVLIIDDYGAFRGSQEATDEYVAQHGVPLFLSRVDEHVRLAIKQ